MCVFDMEYEPEFVNAFIIALIRTFASYQFYLSM